MKCPKCNYVSHDYLDACRKCHEHLVVFKQQMGLFVLQPGMLDLSEVLGARAHDDFFPSRAEATGARTGVEDFDISLDDYAERPLMRAGSGTFIRPNRQEEGRNLQHLTLQIDASAMSAELPRNIAQPRTGSTRQPDQAAPPPLPPLASPQGTAGLPPGHLTLDYDSTSLNLASGSFLQPPGLQNPPPAPSVRTDHGVPPQAGPVEDALSDSIARHTPAPAQLDTSAEPLSTPHRIGGNAPTRGESSPAPAFPRLDPTTDDLHQRPLGNASAVQDTVAAATTGTQAKTERLPLPTLAFLNPEAMTIDVDTNVRGSAPGQSTAQRQDSSSDGLALAAAEQQTTDDALMFDVSEPLDSTAYTLPSPGEILPTGSIPQGTTAVASRTQAAPDANPAGGLGEALNELTATDFGEEDLEFEFHELADATHDDPGMLPDVQAVQLHQGTTSTPTGSIDPNSKQHESMPGHLTLELDASAMSIEYSPTAEESARITTGQSEAEKRSTPSRPAAGNRTHAPTTEAVFAALEDTFELDTRPKAFKSGHVTLELDTNTMQTHLPPLTAEPAERSGAHAGRPPTSQTPQAPQNADELVLDLDGLDDTPQQQ